MKRPPKKVRKTSPRRFTIPDCKNFTGYKPCFPGTRCYEKCVSPDPRGKSILIINLDALGNVLVTTSLLPALKRKYPRSHISWITLKNAVPLLENNPYVDRVFPWEAESWLILQQMQFDLVMNADKSQRSGALVLALQARQKLGFGIDTNGVIVPLNPEAHENYILGLDDHLKFKVNEKTVSRILCETFKLQYKGDEYVLTLSTEEEEFCDRYREAVGIHDEEFVVGFNTGCSELFPNKKMTLEQHVALIERLAAIPGLRLLLVGGPEDTQRNAEIARQAGENVTNTPTEEGIRRGLCYLNICDLVITGDSFGMHAAVGLKKLVIVWFGVSSATEVDLYDRGVKLVPQGLECSPCWKRVCPYSLECIQMIDLEAIERHVQSYHSAWRASGSRGRVYA
jgi:ADP-heptose:LPS heptosyltransferase